MWDWQVGGRWAALSHTTRGPRVGSGGLSHRPGGERASSRVGWRSGPDGSTTVAGRSQRRPRTRKAPPASVPHARDRLAGPVQVSDDLITPQEGDTVFQDVEDAELRDT
jgi:hypothetical protein